MAGFQEVYVSRKIGIKGDGLEQAIVSGPWVTKYKIFDECFFADADEHDWAETTYGTTIDHGAVEGGSTTITAGGTLNDAGELSHTAQWSAAKNCGVEIRMKVSAITTICVCGGLVDARENTNDHVAMEISGTALRSCTVTADFCGFIFDTDQDTDVWYVGASNNGTEGTPVAATGTLAPVANTFFIIRIQTDKDGNVRFYYNGVNVGVLPTAIAYASTNLLTPYVGFIARSTGTPVCTVNRITTWQECS